MAVTVSLWRQVTWAATLAKVASTRSMTAAAGVARAVAGPTGVGRSAVPVTSREDSSPARMLVAPEVMATRRVMTARVDFG
jgi:ABC-type iron transport system FetAB ATPase subunit